MGYQEILDSVAIGQSPLSGRVFIGIPDERRPNTFKVKSDFTERFEGFVGLNVDQSDSTCERKLGEEDGA